MTHNPAIYLFEYLTAIDAQMIVIENHYIDRDYMRDYQSYYASCFKEYPRFCRRLHFFGRIDACTDKMSAERFVHALIIGEDEGDSLAKANEAYLGSIVIRPIPEAIIGKALLRPYKDSPDRVFPVLRQHELSFFGARLNLTAAAFQEQDTTVAACATVAIWTAFQSMPGLFGSLLDSPSKITTTATQFHHKGRSFPSDGLTVQEICRAVRDAGLEPEVFDVDTSTLGSEDFHHQDTSSLLFPSLAYAYMSIGLPIIVGVRLSDDRYHAFTLVGYRLSRANSLSSAKQLLSGTLFPNIANSIHRFYTHDDQVGPYARLRTEITEYTNSEDDSDTIKRLLIIADGWAINNANTENTIMEVDKIIVPVYHKIRMKYHTCCRWVLALNNYLFARVLRSNDGGAYRKEDMPYYWDIALSTINSARGRIRGGDALPAEYKLQALTRQSPKYIWCCCLFVMKKGAEDEKALEIHLDATDMEQAMPVAAVILYNDVVAGRIAATLRNNSSLYSLLVDPSYLGQRLTSMLLACAEERLRFRGKGQ